MSPDPSVSSLHISRYFNTALGDVFRFDFPGTGSLCVIEGTRDLFVLSRHPEATDASLDHVIYDQMLPRILSHEGRLVLHGGGIAIGDKAIAILASTGSGKSTLSASLQSVGHGLLGDDALIVGGNTFPTIRAVYPSLRLLSDSVSHLFGDAAETRKMAHYSAKRHVTVNASDATAPISLLLFLAPPEPTISLRPMSVAQTCMALIANSFALDPTDKVWATANMRRASALAAAVPAYALAYPRDYAALPAVHDAILYKLAEVQTP
jgi:hypothetical protein